MLVKTDCDVTCFPKFCDPHNKLLFCKFKSLNYRYLGKVQIILVFKQLKSRTLQSSHSIISVSFSPLHRKVHQGLLLCLQGDLKALIRAHGLYQLVYCTNLLHLFSKTPFWFIKTVSTIVSIVVLTVGDNAGGAGDKEARHRCVMDPSKNLRLYI